MDDDDRDRAEPKPPDETQALLDQGEELLIESAVLLRRLDAALRRFPSSRSIDLTEVARVTADDADRR